MTARTPLADGLPAQHEEDTATPRRRRILHPAARILRIGLREQHFGRLQIIGGQVLRAAVLGDDSGPDAQDWAVEAARPERFESLVDAYAHGSWSDDEKFALARISHRRGAGRGFEAN